MFYDAKAIANYFLQRAEDHPETPLSPMKLQKLVYYAHGWWLALTDQPLINEQVEAWKFGPVIPSLYRAFRRYGNAPITDYARSSVDRGSVAGDGFYEPEWSIPAIDDRPEDAARVRQVLDRIWEIYGKYTAIQLSNATHQPGTPWHQVYTEYQGDLPRGTDIPADTIKRHFRSLAKPTGPA